MSDDKTELEIKDVRDGHTLSVDLNTYPTPPTIVIDVNYFDERGSEDWASAEITLENAQRVIDHLTALLAKAKK